MPGRRAEDLLDALVEVDAAGRQLQGGPHAAVGEARELRPLVGRRRLHAGGRQRRLRCAAQALRIERSQVEAPAARADGGQQAARLRGDEQEQRARRRLLQRLEKGVGGVGVQLVGAVHDHHAPAALARREPQERAQAAHLVHGDDREQALRP